ncbi:hypothetical protein V8E36_009736 [Tilletia maclaganii]
MLKLNMWTGTSLVSSAYDDPIGEWTIEVKRPNKDNSGGEKHVLKPKVLVQATGHSGKPNVPQFEGQDGFKGLIMHSSQFTEGTEFKGQHAVVIGACNSGHETAQEWNVVWLSDAASITLVQRSSTYIVSFDSVINILFGRLYAEDAPPEKPCPSTDDCDLLFQWTPIPLLKELNVPQPQAMAENGRGLLDGLRRDGFKLDFGSDAPRRGEVKLKQGHAISRFTVESVVFEDGSELKEDVVVLATGYQNMRTTTRKLFGDEVYNRTKDVWDLDEEGEIRTTWRDSGHPGFFFAGGSLSLCRCMSKRLALRSLSAPLHTLISTPCTA